MKSSAKIAGIGLTVVLVAGLISCSAGKSTTYVDAYSSASESSSKTTLQGDALNVVAAALQAGSSDLANAATAKAEGYKAPKSYVGNVMSTNPDGSVGISTMTQWAYTDVKDGTDTVTLQLTYGQNALNLAEVGRRGTLFVPGVAVNGTNGKYFIHLKVTKVDVLKYTDEDFLEHRGLSMVDRC